MKNVKTQKQSKALLAVGIILLAVALIMVTTYAWFTNSVNNGGTPVKFGKIQISSSAPTALTTTTIQNALPGTPFGTADVTATIDKDSQSLYLRAKIAAKATLIDTAGLTDAVLAAAQVTNAKLTEFEAALNAAFGQADFTFTDATPGAQYQWVPDGVGATAYFYLSTDGTTAKTLTAVAGDQTAQPSVTFIKKDKLIVPTSITNDVANSQYGQLITISVSVEAIQSQYLTTDSTVVEVAKAWNA